MAILSKIITLSFFSSYSPTAYPPSQTQPTRLPWFVIVITTPIYTPRARPSKALRSQPTHPTRRALPAHATLATQVWSPGSQSTPYPTHACNTATNRPDKIDCWFPWQRRIMAERLASGGVCKRWMTAGS